MTGIRITTQNVASIIELAEPTLDAMQKAVGGYIERVHPRGLKPPYCMVVNEEGIILELPINFAGCMLYQAPWPIVGDLLILKDGFNADGEPDFVSMEADEALELLAELMYKIPLLQAEEAEPDA